MRPDFIINLPNNRILIVDSKVSLNAYNSYISEDDDDKRKVALKNTCVLFETIFRIYLQKVTIKGFQ
ncbi:MAG: hypothetical protein CM1200mP30_23070 [Pseudomonadota bacterium]|nr:MAG: hypothetical protein CM1200mP30_23070 [Pseudomonadota bacterium]